MEEEKAPKKELEAELDRFEDLINQLKVQYEQYFLGFQRKPEELHDKVVKMMRSLHNAPFKTTVSTYRLKNLSTRYQTYDTYWGKILKQKEDGTFAKDVFKAKMRTGSSSK